jgi:LL-diaminopimelate aminotransferase
MHRASRLDKVPPYLFAEIRRKVAEAKARGIDVISLGIGDPDQPTPDHIISELCRSIRDESDPDRHRYGGDCPVAEFPQAVAEWYGRRFGVELDPKAEVCTLLGSKEGIAHLAWAMVDSGDVTLVPEPGYTVYYTGTVFAGGTCHWMPLVKENAFLPDLTAIPRDVLKAAKLMWLCYPNNPTTAVAPREFLESAVKLARDNDLLICHDLAYGENSYDGYQAPSILEVDGAKEVAIEFNSLSKPFNMTGWRLAFAVGNPLAVEALTLLKDNVDSGVLRAIQFAGIQALTGPLDCLAELNERYRRRRDLVVDTLNQLGWDLEKPKATFYLWCPLPDGYTSSIEFAALLLDKAGVVVTPGIGYGPHGEGYFRISLTYPDDRIEEAVGRIRDALG